MHFLHGSCCRVKIPFVTSVLATPVEDIFAAMFFLSVGALLDFKLIPLLMVPAPVLIAVFIGAKFVTVFLSARAQRIDKVTSVRTAVVYRFLEASWHWL
jgi:CPA2 family monovalent cation:H+ antiporter-2